ncbi:MAG: MAPEG family protein [Arenicella sp.]|nr:MAPEG family protein [Arenicella sp.]
MLITPLFAAVCGLMFLILSFDVISHRRRSRTNLGDGEDPELQKAIRIHGNFSEYVPFTLLLLWLVEVVTGLRTMVVVFGSILLIGRVLHVTGMKDHSKNFRFRQAGVAATFLVIGACSFLLLYSYLPVVTD